MRLLLGTLFSAATLLTIGSAGPALAQDPACTRLEGQPSLVGSRWAGRASWMDGETKDWTIVLRADCVAEYRYDNTTYTNGRWRQRGSMVVFDTNDFFAAYLGHLRSRELSGVMYNQRGATGTWSFRRTD